MLQVELRHFVLCKSSANLDTKLPSFAVRATGQAKDSTSIACHIIHSTRLFERLFYLYVLGAGVGVLALKTIVSKFEWVIFISVCQSVERSSFNCKLKCNCSTLLLSLESCDHFTSQSFFTPIRQIKRLQLGKIILFLQFLFIIIIIISHIQTVLKSKTKKKQELGSEKGFNDFFVPHLPSHHLDILC